MHCSAQCVICGFIWLPRFPLIRAITAHGELGENISSGSILVKALSVACGNSFPIGEAKRVRENQKRRTTYIA